MGMEIKGQIFRSDRAKHLLTGKKDQPTPIRDSLSTYDDGAMITINLSKLDAIKFTQGGVSFSVCPVIKEGSIEPPELRIAVLGFDTHLVGTEDGVLIIRGHKKKDTR